MSRQRGIFPSLILPRNQSIHYLLCNCHPSFGTCKTFQHIRKAEDSFKLGVQDLKVQILNPAKFTVEQVGANVISEAGGLSRDVWAP
ncbi:unnamed protein product [Musa acuminata subsp. burmannicoides]